MRGPSSESVRPIEHDCALEGDRNDALDHVRASGFMGGHLVNG